MVHGRPRVATGKSCDQILSVGCREFCSGTRSAGRRFVLMEGFDEARVKKICGLPCGARVVMVIAAGYPAADNVLFPQYRIPLEEVIHSIG